MEKSLYFEYAEKYFPQLVLSIVEKLNGSSSPLTYLYRDLLNRQFSADGKWASILAQYTQVAADVVALDSELPLKARDTVENVTGDIPKLGLKRYLTEKDIKDINSMIASGQPIARVAARIFQDLPWAIAAVYERIEDIFLSEMSTGIGLSTRSNGTGVRIDVGYRAENQFVTLAAAWKANPTTATPIEDIQQVFDKAEVDGNTITDVYLDDFAYRALAACDEFKSKYAFLVDFVGTNIPTLNFQKVAQVFEDEWNVTLHRVRRKVRTEINGKQQSHSPWAQGRVVFVCDDRIGDLVWTDCVEASRPVDGVVYNIADEFILASTYSKNDPYREITSSQAMVVPIINNTDRIYTLDPKTVAA